jgi:8-oxo-dGTP pyrophosphatase MutT (NUDIX family)
MMSEDEQNDSPPSPEDPYMGIPARWIRQAAAIPIRDGMVCLITSSNGRRWVIPKGMMEPGKTTGEIALQEAWEEAGLVGTLRPQPVGTYLYEKYDTTCHVTVFRMDVSEDHLEYPEVHLRQREWLSPDEAMDRIDEVGLRDLVRLAMVMEVGVAE